MYDPSAGLCAPDYPRARTEEEWAVELREVAEQWGDRDFLPTEAVATCRARHTTSASSIGMSGTRAEREPREAVAFHRMMMDGDVRDVLPAVRCPTSSSIAPLHAKRSATSLRGSRGDAGRGSRIGGRLQLGEHGRERVHARRPVALSEASTARRSSTESSRRCCSPTSLDRRRGPASSATKAGGAARPSSRSRAARARAVSRL